MKNIIKELLPYVLILGGVILIRTFIVTPVIVSGDSMKPNLHNGDLLLERKIGYNNTNIKRFDIVVIKDGKEEIIKRIIGLPGEHISYKNNKLYVNDKVLEENFDFRKTNDFNLEEILYAIMQTNGTLTVLPRSAYSPLTADAVNLKVEESSLPVILVDKGKTIKENLVITKLDDNFIDIQLKKLNIPKKEVVFLSINSNGKMYIQPENGKFQIVQTNYKGDGNW